jgi:UDP-2,4-diacetamido-2,4,6-trideoxy-beta-L-altropyranose hydrolase
MPGHAVFRADASPQIGSGHVRRCLALAATLDAEGWRCTFATRRETLATVSELGSAGVAVHEIDLFDDGDRLAAQVPHGADLLIVDHYGLDARFESRCRGWARRIMVIDDLADRRHDADVLLDSTLDRAAEAYAPHVPQDCRLLLGTAYAPLRPRFAELRFSNASTRNGTVSRLVVSFGATDPHNTTATVIEGIAGSGLAVRTDVLIGGAASHLDQLRERCCLLGPSFRLHVDHDDPAVVLAEADLAIGAAGTSAWERCCLGLPALLVTIVDNQRDNAAALTRSGAVRSLGDAAALTPATVAAALREMHADPAGLRTMGLAAARLCDGLGARRTVLELDPPLARDGRPVRLRPAQRSDGEIMLAWQSQPEARRFSRDPRAPQRDPHFAWLERKLADPHCLFNIVEHGGRPAGILRLDWHADDGSFQVSILIDTQYQRLGLAAAALGLARRLVPHSPLWAEVLPGNDASTALFRQAGYRPANDRWLLSEPRGDNAVRGRALQ